MTTNGILEFQGTEKAIFRGSNSNIVIDTVNSSFGVGVDTPTSNLHIVGKTSLQGDLNLVQVSNVANVTVNSNVVAEYTGPHDRPLRKYPEVALTQNDESATSGYVASASSTATYDTNLQPKNAFNGVISPSSGTASWQSSDSGYSGTTPFNYLNAGTHTVSLTDTDGTVHYGDWLSLQTPNRIKVSYYKIHTLNDVDNYRPDSFVLLGSNSETDGTWKLLHTETNGMTDPGPEVYTGHVNSTEFYTYHRLLVKSLAGNGGEAYINELEYYGHEEGDASLDTTLKSVYNVPATTGTQLEVYYDAKGESTVQSPIPDLSPNTNTGTVAGHSPTLDSTDGIDSFKFNGSSQYVTGTHGLTTGSDPVHTISLWFKRIAKVGQFEYLVQLGQGGTSHQQSAIFLHDDKIAHGHWGGGVYHTDVITDNVWYHIAATYTGGNTSDLSTHKIYVNGVEIGIDAYTSDGPLVLTGTALTLGRNENALGSPGGYFNGSIANFRLYSKALNADQVKELYDYQKDYFLGSKSQVTLYKGHLGVGVTEPSGQLELAGDERIQEYPPGPLTNYETHIPGHGVFSWYTPYYYQGNFETHSGVGMYAKDEGTTGWYGPYNGNSGYTGGNVYAGTDFAATSSSGLGFNDAYGTRYYGAWTTFKLPYKINLKRLRIRQWGTAESINSRCAPEDGVILGSNDGTKWYHVHTFTGLQYGGSAGSYSFSAAGEYVTINCNTDYNQYVLITTRTLHYAFTVIIGELQWFGTPSSTTLDKGSLSLTRSLDVPRVSRYDVDTETPRPEKLVVDFDTTVNSSPTDISGRGNHGTFNGGASYSVADKAFNFNGNNGVIVSESLSPAMTGDKICSMSAWFKTTNASTVNQSIMWLGAYAIGGVLMVSVTNGTLRISIGTGCSLDVAGVIESNRWYHVVGIKQGTGSITSSNFSSVFKLYLNGEPVTGTFGGTARTLNVTSNYWLVGAGHGAGYEAFSGYISNPKLYDTVLEPSEVRKLYNLGRTGRSMVISDTAVGIGKAPEAQLDVRGDIKTSGMVNNAGMGWFISGNGGNAVYTSGENWFSSNGDSTVYGTVKKTRNGADPTAWNATTGFFTAPEDGMYSIDMAMFINGFDGGRWGSFELQDSNSNQVENTYTFYTANISTDDTRSYSKTVYMKKDWKFRFYSAAGTVTLYIATAHSSLNINKIS